MSASLYDYAAGDLPLLISFPHSGTYTPPELYARLTRRAQDLPDTDWFVPELYSFSREIGASVIRATHTRYLVDLNRPPDGTSLYPGQWGTGLCPTASFDGEALYRVGFELDPEEIHGRVIRYWQPYHDKLAMAIKELVRTHGSCILWDAHSIRSTVPDLFAGKLPDLNIGTVDGQSCAAGYQDLIMGYLAAQPRFTHVHNGRFKGGYITRHYGNPDVHVHAVQLEIAQSAYLFESRTPKPDTKVSAPLTALLKNLLQLVSAYRPPVQ